MKNSLRSQEHWTILSPEFTTQISSWNEETVNSDTAAAQQENPQNTQQQEEREEQGEEDEGEQGEQQREEPQHGHTKKELMRRMKIRRLHDEAVADITNVLAEALSK